MIRRCQAACSHGCLTSSGLDNIKFPSPPSCLHITQPMLKIKVMPAIPVGGFAAVAAVTVSSAVSCHAKSAGNHSSGDHSSFTSILAGTNHWLPETSELPSASHFHFRAGDSSFCHQSSDRQSTVAGNCWMGSWDSGHSSRAFSTKFHKVFCRAGTYKPASL